MLRGRKLGVAVAGVASMAVMSILTVPVAQAVPEPTIDEVKTKVDALYQQAETAQERVNDHKLRLKELRLELGSLKSDESREATKLESVRTQVRDQVVSEYQGQGLSSLGQVITSQDPGNLLDQITTMDSVNAVQAGVFENYADASKALELRRQATADQTAEIDKTTRALEAEKSTIDGKLADAKKLLGKLEKEEQDKLFAEASASDAAEAKAAMPSLTDGTTSGRAATAIKYAMSQIGDSYVYGAAGPNAWDCSGLMMLAWGQAGVGLPHSSRMQAGMGTPVSTSALQPGDLVFYYSPISHVGMYIGNGNIVHAANPRAGVKISPVNEMPIAGARRVG